MKITFMLMNASSKMRNVRDCCKNAKSAVMYFCSNPNALNVGNTTR